MSEACSSAGVRPVTAARSRSRVGFMNARANDFAAATGVSVDADCVVAGVVAGVVAAGPLAGVWAAGLAEQMIRLSNIHRMRRRSFESFGCFCSFNSRMLPLHY